MIKPFRGTAPDIHTSAWISTTALVLGDVAIGEHCGLWPGAVIRGDFTRITLGARVIVEDNCVVHSGKPLTIGDDVVIGHGAVVHCASIGNNSLIANNATLLDDAEIGAWCIIGAGCVVSPGMKVPDRSLVFGVPGKVQGEVKPHQMERLERGNAFYQPIFEAYRESGI